MKHNTEHATEKCVMTQWMNRQEQNLPWSDLVSTDQDSYLLAALANGQQWSE